MRSLVRVVVLSVLVFAPVAAQQDVRTFETVTFAATATGFTLTTISPTGRGEMDGCMGKLETAQIRYRIDGTDPTSTVGLLLDVGDVLTLRGHNDLRLFRGIRTGATSGVVNFQCWQD